MTDMKTSRFTEAQILGFLKQAELGRSVKEICRQGGFSEAIFCNWRSKYGGMGTAESHRARELEAENARLKKLLAQARLDIEALKAAFGVKR